MCSGRGDGQLRPPGFPIRTSPDHSLVAGSPGLIAGSNVLHRLLMPRHPPCALINLATTRCSRPLCSSQDTGGPATKPRRIRGEASRSEEEARRPVSSGPNSVPAQLPAAPAVPAPPKKDRTKRACRRPRRITRCPQMSCHPETSAQDMALGTGPGRPAPGAP